MTKQIRNLSAVRRKRGSKISDWSECSNKERARNFVAEERKFFEAV